MGSRSRIENLRERIKKKSQQSYTGEDKINSVDAEKLIEFSDQLDLLNSVYSDYRHEKLLRHCVIMAEETGGLAETVEVVLAAVRTHLATTPSATLAFQPSG